MISKEFPLLCGISVIPQLLLLILVAVLHPWNTVSGIALPPCRRCPVYYANGKYAGDGYPYHYDYGRCCCHDPYGPPVPVYYHTMDTAPDARVKRTAIRNPDWDCRPPPPPPPPPSDDDVTTTEIPTSTIGYDDPPVTSRSGSKKKKTLIVVILDESGSMNIQKSDVIGGYNSFIEDQKAVDGDQARLVLIKFNTHVTISHAVMPLEKVPNLTDKTYKPHGGTALYDAVAEGIDIATATATKDERVLILIMTDGQENASRRMSRSDIKKLLSEKQHLGNWTFAYIGENPEGWANSMGQSTNNVKKYDLQDQGGNMKMASKAVTAFRGQAAPQSKDFFTQ